MKAPRIPSLFKVGEYSQNKRFRYHPRTYDQQQEKFDKKKKEIENEVAYETRMKGSMKHESRNRISNSWLRRETRRQEKNASKRVLLILAALMVLVYLIFFKTDFLG